MKAVDLVRELQDAIAKAGPDVWVETYPHDEPSAGDDIWGVYLEGDTVRLSHN